MGGLEKTLSIKVAVEEVGVLAFPGWLVFVWFFFFGRRGIRLLGQQ